MSSARAGNAVPGIAPRILVLAPLAEEWSILVKACEARQQDLLRPLGSDFTEPHHPCTSLFGRSLSGRVEHRFRLTPCWREMEWHFTAKSTTYFGNPRYRRALKLKGFFGRWLTTRRPTKEVARVAAGHRVARASGERTPGSGAATLSICDTTTCRSPSQPQLFADIPSDIRALPLPVLSLFHSPTGTTPRSGTHRRARSATAWLVDP